MTYRVVFTRKARPDIKRLYEFLEQHSPSAAIKARSKIRKAIRLLADFPFTCRKASAEMPFLRELVISFGSAGYVALFEVTDDETVTIIAIRHQREDDYW